MPNTIQLRRSAVQNAVPTTAQLALGELAINTFDGKLYLKRNNGTESIVEIGAGSGGVTDGDKGDITVSGTGATWTIDTNAVTNAKLAQVGTSTIKGRITAATGNVEDLTAAQVRTIINVADGATANSTDAQLRDRSTHTGTQTASTISDFNATSRAQTEAMLVAGTNVTLTPSGSGATRQITIAASGGGGGGSSISNGTSNVSIATSGGNVTMTVGGTSNVVTVSPTTLTVGTGSGGSMSGLSSMTATNVIGFIQPSAGTITTPPIDLVPGTLTSSSIVGAIEMDGNAIYATENTTSGRGEMGIFHQYRLTADSSAFGPGITDFFPATSSIQLEANSIYEIDAFVWFLKTTAGTATWTWTNSSAASMIRSYYVGTIATGFTTTVVTGAPITGYAIQQTSTALAHAATASLTTAVNHHYHFKVHVWTNAATNLRLRLTQSAGTATPRAGSYYSVRKISTNAGNFAT
jgi:hypothetical protein